MDGVIGRCSKNLYGYGFHGRQCVNSAKVERSGKLYCRMHDPVAVEEKGKNRRAAWDADYAEKEARRDATQKRNTAIERLCGHITTDQLGLYELVKKS